MSILLEPKRIFDCVADCGCEQGCKKCHTALIKAQAKKIYEWGNEVCSHGTSIDGFGFVKTVRRGCQECWKELSKEIES